jgi:hypothetical protein
VGSLAAAGGVDSGEGEEVDHAEVAREYAIPAVMATVDGTRRLADGQPVRVDGTRGLVLRPDPGAARPGEIPSPDG